MGRRRVQTIMVHLARLGIVSPNGEKRHEGTDPVEVQRVVREYAVRAERDRKKLAAMVHYAQTAECRARVLVEYLGETGGSGCGRCDNCAAE
jgi:ATP-dependent DNA helicase RecQ